MKILSEYCFVHSSKDISLFRIPMKQGAMKDIRYKPISKYMEISIPFPQRNSSAIKSKLHNTDHLDFKSIPYHPKQYFYVSNNCSPNENTARHITLIKISDLYIFNPTYQYYTFEKESKVIRKAESREEIEHRKRSINYKLKNIENEEARTLGYEETKMPNIEHVIHATENNAVNNTINNSYSVKCLEKVIFNFRIVNSSELCEVFDRQSVQNALYKMTVCVSGRFILKNTYYEKCLHELRSQIIDLFKRNGTAECGKVKDLFDQFNGYSDESWLVHELADIKDGLFVLRGFREDVQFDYELMKKTHQELIYAVVSECTMLSSSAICEKTGIEESIAIEILYSGGYYHLANNCYTIKSSNNSNTWFNGVLEFLCSKKSISLIQAEGLVENGGHKIDQSFLIEELKKYTILKGSKYVLKS